VSLGVYAGIALGLALLAFAWWFIRWAKRAGADGVRADAAESVVKDATDANQIRDRLRADDGFAKRVRDRFTR
jgi:hypothetical protein